MIEKENKLTMVDFVEEPKVIFSLHSKHLSHMHYQ